ncbi:MAG: hypothetical protein IJL32_04895, partial [Oscillospiraceae bacterium]|nr:hypothetical protein [Oscillospiraceae bacterium]
MKKLISALSSLCLATTSLLGAFPALPAPVAVKANAAGKVVYDLVPHGKTFTAASGTGNNKYQATAGENLTIDWIIKDDPGTAGIQVYLDFKEVEVVKATVGDAYDLTPEFNDSDANKGGQIVYAWAKSALQDCDTDEAICSFNVKVPSTDGTYTVGLDTKEKNKVVPVNENDPYTIEFHGLDIVVGDPSSNKTTEKPAPQPGSNSVIYNIVPSKGTYTDAQSSGKAYNEYTAQPGETLTVDWKIKNDPGTAGIQMYLNFKDVELVKGTVGDAYDLTPEFNTSDANKGGQVVYAWAKDSVQDCDTDEAIASFQIKVPSADGTYYIDLDTKEVNKVVPKDENKPYDIVFYGLKITVGEPGKTTEKPAPQPGENSVIYNIVPSKGTYTDAQSSGKAYNEYTAQPGETLTVDWKVTKDPGTAGIQMYLNFKDVELVKGTVGDAYDLTPEFNTSDANKGGQVVYAWAKDSVQDCDTDEAIASFQIKVPSADGTYYIDLDTKEINKVVPKDETKPYDICFYGLKITVGEPG